MLAISLAEIKVHDGRPVSTGKDQSRFLCGLSADCRSKPADSAHRSLCVNHRTGAFFCHRCNAKGLLREFWQDSDKIKKRSPATVRERERTALQRQFETPAAKPEKEIQPPEKLEKMQQQLSEWQSNFLGSPAETYLNSRCILSAVAAEFGCGYVAQWKHWEKRTEGWFPLGADERVVFPITDKGGNLVAIQARAINQNFVGAEKITKGDKSLGLFQTPNVFKQKVVAVTEGPIDALALQTCGVAAAAMIGTSFPRWLELAVAFRPILIATDADVAGDQAAQKLSAELLPRAARIFRLRPRKAKDWAEVLENTGVLKLTAHFDAFSKAANDELRFNRAWQWFREGREDVAYFTAQLIEDGECREWLFKKFLGQQPS